MSVKQKILFIILIFGFLVFGRLVGFYFTKNVFDMKETDEIIAEIDEEDISDEPDIIFEPQDTEKEENIRVLSVNVSMANIRANRGTTYDIIERLNRDDLLMPVDFFRSWWKVRLPDGRYGWIFRNLIKFRELSQQKWNEYFDLEKFEEIDRNKEENILNIVKDDYIYIIVNRDILNVRLSYSTAYQVISRVYYNDVLKLLGYSNNWAKVELETGIEGWVFAENLKIASFNNENELALYDFSVDNIRRNVIATARVSHSNTSVRSGPGNEYSSLMFLTRESIFEIILEYNDFYFIYFDNVMGWIHKDYVRLL